MVAVVQLVRASDCGSECRGFELNVVGSSPICHPKEKRNASNDFPLFCCAASRDSRRECQCLLIEEKKQVTSAANYHWLSVQVLLDTLLFMQRYFASYPWILLNPDFPQYRKRTNKKNLRNITLRRPLRDRDRIQTCNRLIRSQLLYSVELRDPHLYKISTYENFRDSYRIQTCNLLIRSQMLYSVELRSLLFLRLQRYALFWK